VSLSNHERAWDTVSQAGEGRNDGGVKHAEDY
jgi:hypothetical protein